MATHEDSAQESAPRDAGNWQRFKSFAWHTEPESDSDLWMIANTTHRDAGLIEQSNHAALKALLAPFSEETCCPHGANHWAVGWVEGYEIKVFTDASRSELTPAYLAYCEWRDAIENYPIFDENDYSRREYEATLENIESVGRCMVKDGAPEDWPGQCCSWFWDHNQRAVENHDDQGGCPDDGEMRECLEALNLLESEEE